MKRNISTTKTKLWREKPQAFGRCDLGRVLCVSQIISYCQRLFSRRYPLLDRMKFVETNYSTWCISQSPLILLSLLGIIPAPLPGWPRCHGYANGSFDNEIALENILRRLLQLNSSDIHVNEYSLMTAHIWVYGGRSISEIVVTRRKSPIPPVQLTTHSRMRRQSREEPVDHRRLFPDFTQPLVPRRWGHSHEPSSRTKRSAFCYFESLRVSPSSKLFSSASVA